MGGAKASDMRCATCAHWRAEDTTTAYAATCSLGVFPGRVPFDLTCDEHSGKPQKPVESVDMQSQVRGTMHQMWGMKVP